MHIQNNFWPALIFISVSANIPGSVSSQQAIFPASYTATAVHRLPGQPASTGTIVKSGENLRLEFEQDGKKIIQILLPETGTMYILDTTTRSYFEIQGQAVLQTNAGSQTTPCGGQSHLALCQRVGTDTVSGIQVERWLLASDPQSTPLTILWDPTRRHALRQDFPDGSTTLMVFSSMEDIDGRTTEHWMMQIQAPGQETLDGDWWFDPELRVVVRENLPGGETRSLENIVVGKVDPSAFQVPYGWQLNARPMPSVSPKD